MRGMTAAAPPRLLFVPVPGGFVPVPIHDAVVAAVTGASLLLQSVAQATPALQDDAPVRAGMRAGAGWTELRNGVEVATGVIDRLSDRREAHTEVLA